jgi:hypothetical protein
MAELEPVSAMSDCATNEEAADPDADDLISMEPAADPDADLRFINSSTRSS